MATKDLLNNSKLITGVGGSGVATNSQSLLVTSTESNSGAAGNQKEANEEFVSKINTLQAGLEYQGSWDASTGVFPSNAKHGYMYNVSTAGTVDGVDFAINDELIATKDNPSTTTYINNWDKKEHVSSINTTSVIVSDPPNEAWNGTDDKQNEINIGFKNELDALNNKHDADLDFTGHDIDMTFSPVSVKTLKLYIESTQASYSTGNNFQLKTVATDGTKTPLVYGTDYTCTEYTSNMFNSGGGTMKDANRDTFLNGGLLNYIVTRETEGNLILNFKTAISGKLELSISGRNIQTSTTSYRFELFDISNNQLWENTSSNTPLFGATVSTIYDPEGKSTLTTDVVNIKRELQFNGVLFEPNILRGGLFVSNNADVLVGTVPSVVPFSDEGEQFGILDLDGTSKIKATGNCIIEAIVCPRVRKIGGGTEEVYLFVRKNGVDIPNSAIPVEGLSSDNTMVPTLNIIVQMNTDDYIEIVVMASRSREFILDYQDASTVVGAVRPAVPSITGIFKVLK